MTERPVLALLVPLVAGLAAIPALAWGLHYVGADGGNPQRTHGNHVAGLILLATVAVLVGIAVAVSRIDSIRWLVVALLVTSVVTVGGAVAAEHAITVGERCACEGG